MAVFHIWYSYLWWMNMHVCSIYYVPDTVLGSLHQLTHLTITTTLWGTLMISFEDSEILVNVSLMVTPFRKWQDFGWNPRSLHYYLLRKGKGEVDFLVSICILLMSKKLNIFSLVFVLYDLPVSSFAHFSIELFVFFLRIQSSALLLLETVSYYYACC